MPESFRFKHRATYTVYGIASLVVAGLMGAMALAAVVGDSSDPEAVPGSCAGAAAALAIAVLVFRRRRYTVALNGTRGVLLPGKGWIDWGAIESAWLGPETHGCLWEVLALLSPSVRRKLKAPDNVVHLRYRENRGGPRGECREAQLAPLEMSTKLVRMINDRSGHSRREGMADSSGSPRADEG
jgi:hypothetical protein